VNIFELLKKSIPNAEELLLALRLVRDLTDGTARLDPQTRGEMQAKILELESEVGL